MLSAKSKKQKVCLKIAKEGEKNQKKDMGEMDHVYFAFVRIRWCRR